jgi:type VI secretion system protein ImpB
MSNGSSQGFIGRNRPPRVQIQYDLDLNGAKKKVQLPFIMGVMADLAGKSESREARTPAGERKFLEIDVDNFNNRMAALAPRVVMRVKDTLKGESEEDKLAVDLTFQSMDDFTPDAVANKVEPLRKLLAARRQLASLLTFMDGRDKAEELLTQVLTDPQLLASVSQALKDMPQPANPTPSPDAA